MNGEKEPGSADQKKNELYYGDNLDVLRRKIERETVDLCYIDPPFNSKRNYFQIYNNQGGEDAAQAQAFVDTWSWGDEAAEGLEYILDIERLAPPAGQTRWTEQTVELIRGLEKVLGRGSLLAYLVHMTLRIVEIHRVLKPILLDGVPRDLESAMALANRKDDKTRKEFEKWAILTFSNNQARINEKKGADGGIDGIAYFLLDKDTNGKAIFQVKSRPGNRGDLATLNSDRLREKAEFGFLICTGLPTKPMREEIAAAGKFRHPLLNREDDRLQVITVAELFDRPNSPARRLDLPMARTDAVKSAKAQGDAAKQQQLI